MVSFLCTIWGKKYSPEYVSKLYRSVQKFYSGEFEFYCQTDQKLDIPGVIEIPFLEFLPDASARFPVKPKVNFWKPNGWGITGRKIFLDLDVVICKDITEIVGLYVEKPLIAKSWWQDQYGINQEAGNHLAYRGIVNSSVIVWEDTEYTSKIWESFERYSKYIFFCCINGQDGFLSSMHLDKFDFIPKGYVGSYHNEDCREASIVLVDTKKNHIQYGTQKELHELSGWISEKWNVS